MLHRKASPTGVGHLWFTGRFWFPRRAAKARTTPTKKQSCPSVNNVDLAEFFALDLLRPRRFSVGSNQSSQTNMSLFFEAMMAELRIEEDPSLVTDNLMDDKDANRFLLHVKAAMADLRHESLDLVRRGLVSMADAVEMKSMVRTCRQSDRRKLERAIQLMKIPAVDNWWIECGFYSEELPRLAGYVVEAFDRGDWTRCGKALGSLLVALLKFAPQEHLYHQSI